MHRFAVVFATLCDLAHTLRLAALVAPITIFAAATVPAPSPAKAPLLWTVADEFYQTRGEFGHARTVLENVRAHLRAAGRGETIEFINPSARLAKLSSRLGDFDRSTALYREVETRCVAHFGRESVQLARVKTAEATMLFWAARYDEAESAARFALALAETVSGMDGVEAANASAILGATLEKSRRLDEAAALMERSHAIYVAHYGSADQRTRSAQFNLASVYLSARRLDEAKAAFHASSASSLVTDGSASPNDMELYRGLVVLGITTEDHALALENADRLFDAQVRLIRETFPAMNEEDRLKAKGQLELVSWYASLGDVERIARAVLATKGITLETLVEPRRAGSVPRLARLLDPANAAEGFEPVTPAMMAELEAAHTDGSAMAARMAAEPASLSPLTAAQICARLPADTALIEFVRYEHESGGYRSEGRYGALVFQPNPNEASSSRLVWIPLGAAAPIERELGNLLKSVSQPLTATPVSGALRSLYERVWAPLARILGPEIKSVFVSPDGALCFLPFAALIAPDDTFLGESQLISFLSTARDLFVDRRIRTGDNRQFAIFAAPDFGRSITPAESPMVAFRDVEIRSLSNLQLTDLPGSRLEADVLHSLAVRHRFESNVFLGPNASEEAVRSLDHPHVIHFATHGFVLDPPAMPGALPTSPMDRSGLALAGAQHTLAALAHHTAAAVPTADGILTAREVMRLPLQGTWLVTLAACDTGQGEVRDGESVLGLRRGFLAAGVQNLLLSLWAVADRSTVDFMRDFYDRALGTGDAPRAFALTQRAWLVRLRRERGISVAVTTVGSFVLNGSGQLHGPGK